MSDRTLVEMFERTCSANATRPAVGTRRDGAWHWTSYGELRDLVDAARWGLAQLGVTAGDRVAIVADNRLEWIVAAYATYGLGAVFVPMYQAQRDEDRVFILRDSEAVVALAATDAIAGSLGAHAHELPALRRVVSLEGAEDRDGCFAALLARGRERPVPIIAPAPEDPATLIYTSGTTGKPKGVILTHRNVMSNVNAVHEVFDFGPDDCSLAFIPWAHVFGQTCELHTLLSLGASMAVNDALPNLLENLKEVRPTVLVAVPRIFNKIFAGVHATVADRSPAVRHLFDAGVRASHELLHHRAPRLGDRLALALADPLIFSRVRERFGGRLKYAVSGGAALAVEVAELIEALGVTVYEGYGLTETSPMVAANRPGSVKLGSVGKCIPGVTVRIDRSVGQGERDGEIVVFGPNVMKGYHHRPEEQAQALTPDGGFRTGDLGHVDEDGFLFITGRIKEQYKLSNGKYVAPAPLEEQLKLSPFIANAMIHGANRPYNVALVVLDVLALEKWADHHGVRLQDPERDPHVRELIEHELTVCSSSFREYERPRRFLLTTEDFSVENGLLTPTLKLKRAVAETRYGDALEEMYRDAAVA